MTLRQLGNSDLYITPVGLGAWAIGGGKWEFAWGPQDDKDSIEAIHAGFDQGVNWIDTAAVYGLGHSETVVGRAMSARTCSRNAAWSGMSRAQSRTTSRPLPFAVKPRAV